MNDSFEILFPMHSWRFNFPCVHVGPNTVYLNSSLMKTLDLNGEGYGLIAINHETKKWYFCVLPELSERRGYSLNKCSTGDGASMCSKSMVKRGLEEGYYRVLFGETNVFKYEIDWYEIEKIKEDEMV